MGKRSHLDESAWDEIALAASPESVSSGGMLGSASGIDGSYRC
jgi:hypothetical protein